MRTNLIGLCVLTATMCMSASAMADDADTVDHRLHLGTVLTIGAPVGIGLGLAVNPGVQWLTLSANFTDNVLAPGAMFAAKFDPIAAVAPHSFVGVYADVEGGFAGQGNVPGQGNFAVGYDYANFYAGLRVGRTTSFSWFLGLGPSFLHISTANFQSLVPNTTVSNLTISNPRADGWVFPTAATGFQWLF
jgi:hypothetical protein